MKRTDLMNWEGSVFPGYRSIDQIVSAQVILGSPGAACRGVGVCRVVPMGSRIHFECPVIPVKLGFVTGGKLRFLFEKAALSAEIKARHFDGGLFEVSVAYTLPRFICRQLGCFLHTIEPGIYPVIESDYQVLVEF